MKTKMEAKQPTDYTPQLVRSICAHAPVMHHLWFGDQKETRRRFMMISEIKFKSGEAPQGIIVCRENFWLAPVVAEEEPDLPRPEEDVRHFPVGEFRQVLEELQNKAATAIETNSQFAHTDASEDKERISEFLALTDALASGDCVVKVFKSQVMDTATVSAMLVENKGGRSYLGITSYGTREVDPLTYVELFAPHGLPSDVVIVDESSQE